MGLLQKVPNKFEQFETVPDDKVDKIGRWLSLVYWIISTGAFCAFIALNATEERVVAVTVKGSELDFKKYKEIEKFSPTCQCSSDATSIPMETFLTYSYTLEPICAANANSVAEVDSNFGLFINQTKNLCDLARELADNTVTASLTSSLTSSTLFTSNTLEGDVMSRILNSRESVIVLFGLPIEFIREWTSSNVPSVTNHDFKQIATSLGGCDCTKDFECQHIESQDVAGIANVEFVYGCDALVSLAETEIVLAARYFLQAINQGLVAAPNDKSGFENIAASDKLTVAEMIREMFVKHWNATISYEKYFNECNPKSCTYEESRPQSIISIISTALGLIGGITALTQTTLGMVMNFMLKISPAKKDDVESLHNVHVYPSQKKDPPSSNAAVAMTPAKLQNANSTVHSVNHPPVQPPGVVPSAAIKPDTVTAGGEDDISDFEADA